MRKREDICAYMYIYFAAFLQPVDDISQIIPFLALPAPKLPRDYQGVFRAARAEHQHGLQNIHRSWCRHQLNGLGLGFGSTLLKRSTASPHGRKIVQKEANGDGNECSALNECSARGMFMYPQLGFECCHTPSPGLRA